MSARFLYLFIFLLRFASASYSSEFSIIDEGELTDLFHRDYSPPPPPPPSLPPQPPPLSCEELKGIGSVNTTCELNHSLNFTEDIFVKGEGNFFILQGVVLACPYLGCSITINISGEFKLSSSAEIRAGSVYVVAGNATLSSESLINSTALGGEPPVSFGTPDDGQGGGGGFGGRGASCMIDNQKLPQDVWGGDSYGWEDLATPFIYGSKGGTTSKVDDYGGKGGGRIRFEVADSVDASGVLLADGGDGGIKGGGGSGGSIHIKTLKMTGNGKFSASGGNGFAGGGGGRVSVDAFSRHDDPIFLVHGGRSFGCPTNAGAAGTFYDAIPRRLMINNQNMSTDTETLLFAFPNQPLWTNVYIVNLARATVPMPWSRVQVQGQLSLSCGAVLTFGLIFRPLSEFELMAEELLMSDSTIKIYGALRMSVKIHLMLNSKMLIDGDSDTSLSTSLLEASNLVVLKGSSEIRSNANLGIHGQGSLNLTGPGDLIEAQHLVLSLFYSISLGPGSTVRGPVQNASKSYMATRLPCHLQSCPVELLHPPEDCNVNASLSFTLQICRVEDVIVEGLVEGSVVHFHWVRTVFVKQSGAISASGLGCYGGLGKGEYLPSGLSSGAGHGGRGGDTYYNGSYISGGVAYGNAELPCELGSGSGNSSLPDAVAGGGIVVIGSLEHAVSSLSILGSLQANGEDKAKFVSELDDGAILGGGSGGGSGGTILLFIHTLSLGNSSIISAFGGYGSTNGGGGGGGGRVHFHWSDISTGDEYLPIASVNGIISASGGIGRGFGHDGENGTISGRACPKGLYGIFCQECPVGTYKNESGSDGALCQSCPSHELPRRAIYIAVRGGVTDAPCPYKCVSDLYHMPHCYTALEELIYTFGGPWIFGFLLLCLLVLLALVLSVARMKFVTLDESPGHGSTRRSSPIDRSFPFLESLNEVLETSRNEESQTHVHRMYFMGANTFWEPWHLHHSPPKEVKEIVYEDAFNRFVDEINNLAYYHWWEGSVYSILSILVYPLAWSWLQHCRKKKIQQLREFVRSEYDHACLRSCRSRALYEGLKVAASSDLMLAYVDFFLGGDEKRDDLPPRLHQRFPLCIVFGGDGSYMAPFSFQSDNILTCLMSQSVPPTIWYRLVAGLNAQLRLVRQGHLRATLAPVVCWLETHAKPTLRSHGVIVDLACFQPSASGYRQFGLVICAVGDEISKSVFERPDRQLSLEKESRLPGTRWRKALDLVRVSEHSNPQRKISGEILNKSNLQMLKEKMTIDFPFYFIIRNTKPIGHQDVVGMMMSVLLLGDVSLVLLTLLQLYSSSLLDFFLVLFILPLCIILPFPAGINALFSHGPRRSAGFMRGYALWNITSVLNVVVAFICGFIHFKTQSSSNKKHSNFQSWNFSMDESGWWMLPSGLLLCKICQARLINYHVANLEVQDRTLYSTDPEAFWRS
ncbi:OLC1v1037607C1 [Oldenlandia corymbosa var. corymbosa]|uniref:OLC1v1037607C1 n=1 Tax=Oldenlandia corymbosa var. corymbosa TaxID=529605 RepID=A0AAV1CYF7_OLDCO|nr:OLC1v1037607C1 [Oldenlandia corymbosa var. corymbosa]